jgi:hypothetical protein
MNQIPRYAIKNVISHPEHYAEEMTVDQIDNVVAGFISVRYDKQRWSK